MAGLRLSQRSLSSRFTYLMFAEVIVESAERQLGGLLVSSTCPREQATEAHECGWNVFVCCRWWLHSRESARVERRLVGLPLQQAEIQRLRIAKCSCQQCS